MKDERGKNEHMIIQLNHRQYLAFMTNQGKPAEEKRRINKTTKRMRIEIELPASNWDEAKSY